MTKLNGIIAVEKDMKAHAHKIGSEIHNLVQKPALFDGLYRTYRPKTEEGEVYPADRKHVQYKVMNLLKDVESVYIPFIDLTLQKDEANMQATADLIVDGKTIYHKVPVVTLLFLEKQITDHRSLIDKLPTLDIAEEWEEDKQDSHFYRAQLTAVQRTKKVQEGLTLYPHTAEHPAQTTVITRDVLEGYWDVEKVSGAIPRKLKERMRNRADALLRGIKEARERGNDREAGPKPTLGQALYHFLNG